MKVENEKMKNNGSVGTSKEKQFEIYYFNKRNKLEIAFIYNGTYDETNN